MNNKIDRIIMMLRENKPILEEKYKVKTLGVFGSYVRGEQGGVSNPSAFIGVHLRLIFNKGVGKQYD